MGTKVEFTFNPLDLIGASDVELSPATVKRLQSEVADYVLREVKDMTASQTSAVTGDPWTPLSPDYAKKKKAIAGNKKANLELYGDMLDGLKTIKRSGGDITLTVVAAQQGKADGHNNFSGKSKLPERKFIPNAEVGESFAPEIIDGIKTLVDDAIESDQLAAEEAATTKTIANLQKLLDEGLGVKIIGTYKP